jgi:hypothetical protein
MTRIGVFFILGGILFSPLAFAQNSGFDSLASAFEARLNAAAENWQTNQAIRALDGFKEAREWISRAPIPYGDAFAWSGCRALMTYSIVLSRLVEAETERKKKSALAHQIESQAKQWAEILYKQIEAWSKIKPITAEQSALRLRWIKRFQAVISKTRHELSSE